LINQDILPSLGSVGWDGNHLSVVATFITAVFGFMGEVTNLMGVLKYGSRHYFFYGRLVGYGRDS